jgi:benzoyl-CoA reductase subunit B
VTSEPYAASIAFQREFSYECLEATEKAGYARALCAYMRNYWGWILLDKWAFADDDGKRIPFPEPDFIWQDHICCSHAKWYQVVRDLKGDIPIFCVDVASGPYVQLNENRLEYVAGQLRDGIE